MSAPSSIDEYIAAASDAARPMLKELRETIRTAAPEADEGISYGMPAYYLRGRLAYFQAHARHIGLYSFSLEDARGVGLEGNMSAKSTLRFPLNQPLPRAAIRRLIQQRVRSSGGEGLEKLARKR
ncbi:MAG: DUF1801 domain-containing protein [Candidatus Dormiibacterota bacterium]